MRKLSLLLFVGALIMTSSCKKEEPEPQNNNNNNGTNNPTVQQELNNGKSPLQLYNEGHALTEIYGNTYKGGLIVYLDVSTGEGLVSTSSDIASDMEWASGSISTFWGLTDTTLWAGASNTATIASFGIASCHKTCADLSLNGFDDWYLPSKHELRLVYQAIGAVGTGNLTQSAVYWSSSEVDIDNAWRLINYSGQGIQSYLKIYPSKVRAVRKFDS